MIIGLTGGIACGKSTVSKMFFNEGIPVIDTDKISKDILTPQGEAYPIVKEAFGEDIILKTGHINRKALAKIIFNDEEQRERLNDIMHPIVRKITQKVKRRK